MSASLQTKIADDCVSVKTVTELIEYGVSSNEQNITNV